jgi:hypothetical protein
MKGVRFYLEYPEDVNPKKFTRKNLGNHSGNVFALFDVYGDGRYWRVQGNKVVGEGLGAVYFSPNSPVATTGASPEFIEKRCKRISEEQAREIHPQLFATLDYDPDKA